MFISRRQYEQDIQRAREEGRMEVYRVMDEERGKRYMMEKLEVLEKEVIRLKNERRDERKYAGTVNAVDSGCDCPPDRLDI